MVRSQDSREKNGVFDCPCQVRWPVLKEFSTSFKVSKWMVKKDEIWKEDQSIKIKIRRNKMII